MQESVDAISKKMKNTISNLSNQFIFRYSQKKTRMPDFADSPARPAFGRRASQGDEGGPGRGRRGAYSLLERTVVLPIRRRQRPIDPSSGTLPGCEGNGMWLGFGESQLRSPNPVCSQTREATPGRIGKDMGNQTQICKLTIHCC